MVDRRVSVAGPGSKRAPASEACFDLTRAYTSQSCTKPFGREVVCEGPQVRAPRLPPPKLRDPNFDGAKWKWEVCLLENHRSSLVSSSDGLVRACSESPSLLEEAVFLENAA